MKECIDKNIKLVENPPIVKIRDLTIDFEEVRALDNVNLDIPEGKIIGLLGANGSGKTTLMRILAGLYNGYEGETLIEGNRPGAESKAMVSYLPDRPAFSLSKSAKDIRVIYEEFFQDFSREKFNRLLDTFDIDEKKPFKEMSKGMIDKVQISLVMARDARLYLLDEPLGGVDVGARESVLTTILENFDAKGTIIVATHLISEIERLFDSVIVLDKGKVIIHEDCEVVREKYGEKLEEVMKEIFRGGAIK